MAHDGIACLFSVVSDSEQVYIDQHAISAYLAHLDSLATHEDE